MIVDGIGDGSGGARGARAPLGFYCVYLTTQDIATSMRASPEYELTASLVVSISISESADFARQNSTS